MANIIHAAKQIHVKIGFEMRLEELLSVHAHLIFIRIDHIHRRIFIQCRCKFKQRIGRDKVIMVHQHNIIALCHRKRPVCVAGNPLVLSKRHIADPLIPLRILL